MKHRITMTTATGTKGNIETYTDKVWFNHVPTRRDVAKLAHKLNNEFVDVKPNEQVVMEAKIKSITRVYDTRGGKFKEVYSNKLASELEMFESGIFNYDAVTNEGFNTKYIDINEIRKNDVTQQVESN